MTAPRVRSRVPIRGIHPSSHSLSLSRPPSLSRSRPLSLSLPTHTSLLPEYLSEAPIHSPPLSLSLSLAHSCSLSLSLTLALSHSLSEASIHPPTLLSACLPVHPPARPPLYVVTSIYTIDRQLSMYTIERKLSNYTIDRQLSIHTIDGQRHIEAHLSVRPS